MAFVKPSSNTLKDFIPNAAPMRPAVLQHLQMSFSYIDASMALGKAGNVESSGIDSCSVAELKEYAKQKSKHSESAKIAMHVHELNCDRLGAALDVMCMPHYSCAPQTSTTQFRLPRATRLFLGTDERPLQTLLDYSTSRDGVTSWSLWRHGKQSTISFGGMDGTKSDIYFTMQALKQDVLELVPEASLHLFFTETVPLSKIAAHFGIPNDTPQSFHVSVFIGFVAATVFRVVIQHLHKCNKLLVCGTSLGGSVATVFAVLAESAMRLRGGPTCVLCSTTNGVQCCRGKSPYVQEPCESAIEHFEKCEPGLFCAQFVHCAQMSKKAKTVQFAIDPVSILNCERGGTLNFVQDLTLIGGGMSAHFSKRHASLFYKDCYADVSSNGQSSVILCLIAGRGLAKSFRPLFKLPSKSHMQDIEAGARFVHVFTETMFQVISNVLTRFRALSHFCDIELREADFTAPEYALSLYLFE